MAGLLQRVARYVSAFVVAALAAGAGLAADGGARPASATGIDSLAQAIDQVLTDPRLAGSQADVLVRSAGSGEVLYTRSPANRLVPASNAKLYSSLAAMDQLGPDYRFTTTVAATGGRDATSAGTLYLRGTGDPTLQPADYDALAAAVAASGLRSVTGPLVADDTFFDHRQLGNNWAWDNSPFSFQPEISALTVAADANFDVGSLTVEVRPGAAAGQPAQVRTVPATSFVRLVNQATTGAAGTGDGISVERRLGVNDIVVSGSIALDVPLDSSLSTVSNPTGYAASLFRDALARHGVRVAGATVAGVATPAGARTVASRQSEPLSQLLIPFLKLSNNAHAEILVKTLGQKVHGQGTWGAGLSVVTDVASRLGVDTSALQLVDGSGLSNLDFVPAQQTTNLLIGAQQEPWFSTWFNALPIAGEPDPLVGGTLRARMGGTAAAGNVHGKTGTLTGASALSGYVTDADGERLVFSIMENNYLSGAPKDLEDRIAIDLANFSRSMGVPAAAAHAAMAAPPRPGPQLECSWTKAGC